MWKKSARKKSAPVLAEANETLGLLCIDLCFRSLWGFPWTFNKIIADIELPMTLLSRPSTHFLTDWPVGRHSLGQRIRKGQPLQSGSVKIRTVVRNGDREGGGVEGRKGIKGGRMGRRESPISHGWGAWTAEERKDASSPEISTRRQVVILQNPEAPLASRPLAFT